MCKKVSNLIYPIMIVLIISVYIITSLLVSSGARVSSAAVSTADAFEQRNVLDDLAETTINGKPFNLSDYPKNEQGDIQVINFAEFCYSYYANNQEDFGLYVYVYNPSGLNLALNDVRNKIQISIGNLDFVKYSLLYINQSTVSGYEGRFYKLKVVLMGSQREKALNALSPAERTYEVSGIELVETDSIGNATEYIVARTYTFKGYAQGYGQAGLTEPLTCEAKESEVVSLEVKNTFYRTKTSSLGAGYQVQIDTAYFSVPKYLFERYGQLQRIKAEWYEYKTKYIAVTSSEDFYNQVLPYMGTRVGEGYNSDIYYGLIDNVEAGQVDFIGRLMYNYYNFNWIDYLSVGMIAKNTYIDTLYYLFSTHGKSISEYDPYAETVSIGGITSNELTEYIQTYVNTFNDGTLPIKNQQISADLFEKDIDSSRKMDNEYGKIQQGYSYYDFDASTDLQEIKTYNPSNNNFMNNWEMYGFWKALFHKYGTIESGKTLPPIQVLQESDITGTDKKAISDTLCVNFNDVDKLQAEYQKAEANNEYLVLFRFATSDYFSSSMEISFGKLPDMWADNAIDGCAYVAQQSVFFDFDIIQLTFKNDLGELKIIPVVSNPIDIIDDITPPPNFKTPGTGCQIGLAWWEWLLIVIAVLIIILPPTRRCIIRTLTAPFKKLINLNENKKE